MSKLYDVLGLARRFGPIWAQTPARTGYRGTNGSKDATRDEGTICRWWTEHPGAVPALLTGEVSGVVALDIDIKNGRNGLDALELLGITVHPTTPTAHTPSGGLHVLFRWPGRRVASSSDKIGPGLEVKGDGSWITLPPGPGRLWDPHLGIETPLAPMPEWMIVYEPQHKRAGERPSRSVRLTRYAEAALDSAVKAIVSAPAGRQHATLNRECFAIGGLVGGGIVPSDLALASLQWAARQMPSHDSRRPWQPAELQRQVREAFLDGLQHPRRGAA
jgi:Bifunctional DNA primase/polymerase, N-terminal